MRRQGAAAPLHQGIEHGRHGLGLDPEGRRRCRHPGGAALHTEGIGRFNQLGASMHQGPSRGAQEGLGQQHPGALAHRRQLGGAAGRQAAHHRQAHAGEQGHEAVFNAIGQGAHDQQLLLIAGGHQGEQGHQGLVLPLGEGGFDAAAGVIEHPHPAAVAVGEPLGRLGQIELDHLAGAGTHQKQSADLGAPLQQIGHQAIEFLIGISQTGQVPLPQDRRAEAGFGKDHHAGGALDQVGAGAGAHHQEEGIRHAAMQPHDRGEAAEHLSLAVFSPDLRLPRCRPRCGALSLFGLSRFGLARLG